MKEGQFNSELVRKLNSMGVVTQKIADRFTPGIPDIYIAGGNWIESKIIKAKTRVDLYQKLSPQQRTVCARLCGGGDKVLVVSYWEHLGKVLVVPFPYLIKEHNWTAQMVEDQGFPLGRGILRHDYAKQIFSDGSGGYRLSRKELTSRFSKDF